nr:claudin-10 [Nothobranchius furzeri]
MQKRLIQILGFLVSSLGWLFVLCTLAMDYWRTSQLGGQGGSNVIKVAWYWSNLWKDCYTDSTAVTNCRDYPVLWNVSYYVQAVRGLLMCGLSLGFCAVLCCFIGMDCTYLGGTDQIKDKLVFSGAVLHFVGCISDLSAYCLYINRIVRTALAARVGPGVLRYYLGPPIFLGLVGCFLVLFGAVLYAVTVLRIIFPGRTAAQVNNGGTFMPPAPTEFTGYYAPSRLNGSYVGSGRPNSKISRLSQKTPAKISERDAFV